MNYTPGLNGVAGIGRKRVGPRSRPRPIRRKRFPSYWFLLLMALGLVVLKWALN
jgi:hypothetical protein